MMTSYKKGNVKLVFKTGLLLYHSLRQFSVLHSCSSSDGPRPCSRHVFPPFDGGGFVQVLVRFWVPPPHVALHPPQLDQVL